MVHHFRLILRAQASQELPFRLRHTEPVKGAFDVIGDIVPGFLTFFGGLYIKVNLIEIKVLQGRPPVWHRSLQEVLEGLQAELKHPLRLALHARNIFNNFAVQTLLRLERIVIVTVVKTVLVLANIF